MNKTTKLMLAVTICFAVAAFAQNQLPAPPGPTQTPSYPDAGTKGIILPNGQTPYNAYDAVNNPNGVKAPTQTANGMSTFGKLPTGASKMANDSYAVDPGQQFNSKWAMVNGNHDLTTYAVTGKTTSWGSTTAVAPSRICSFCHTAHDNEGTADRTFLWAHALPSSFGTPYSSPTLQSSPTTTATSQTAQCLGCHDGTVALSSGAYGTPPADGSANFSVDTGSGLIALTSGGKLINSAAGAFVVPLSRTHPVSFAYSSALAAQHQLRVPANDKSVDGFGIVPLFNGNMECATCHDPHIKTGIMRRQFPTGASQDNNTGSFCLYCHL